MRIIKSFDLRFPIIVLLVRLEYGCNTDESVYLR